MAAPLKLYYLSGSPICWKVWLAPDHKMIEYELRILTDDAGDLTKSSVLSISPRGKVPVIAHEGFTLKPCRRLLGDPEPLGELHLREVLCHAPFGDTLADES